MLLVRRSARQVAVLLAAGVAVIALLLLVRRPSSGPGPTPSAAPRPSAAASASASATPVANAPAVLVGAGDIADCNSDGDEATARLLDAMEGTVFTLGDNAYDDGTPDEFQRCYEPGWGRYLPRTKPVPGNHDYRTEDAAGYFGYFGAAAGDPAKGWYAYDAGPWRVYALNSNCAEVGGCEAGSPQERWLRQDLADNPRACVLAMWHHPRFSSGEHGNDDVTDGLWRALYDAGAELILNGHDHDYERFAPQSPGGEADAERGIVEMVVGTGGRSHYPLRRTRANSLVLDNTAYGVLRLELADGGWSFEFVRVPGAAFTDSGTGTCH